MDRLKVLVELQTFVQPIRNAVENDVRVFVVADDDWRVEGISLNVQTVVVDKCLMRQISSTILNFSLLLLYFPLLVEEYSVDLESTIGFEITPDVKNIPKVDSIANDQAVSHHFI